MQSCFLLKPAVFFAFLTLYVGTAIHIKSSKLFGVTGVFDYYVKVYREAETRPYECLSNACDEFLE